MIKNTQSGLSEISNRDCSFIEQTHDLKFIGYAISYVQTVSELLLFKKFAKTKPITAKIEQEKGFLQLKQIGEAADVSWLCRGDLGVSAQIYDLN